MMRFLRAFTVILAIGGDVTFAADRLAGSQWNQPGQQEVFVRFGSGGKITGFAGCNSFTGKYQAQSILLTIEPLATTRKMCGSTIMQAEQAFLQNLESSKHSYMAQSKLRLADAVNVTLLLLDRRD